MVLIKFKQKLKSWAFLLFMVIYSLLAIKLFLKIKINISTKNIIIVLLIINTHLTKFFKF